MGRKMGSVKVRGDEGRCDRWRFQRESSVKRGRDKGILAKGGFGGEGDGGMGTEGKGGDG